MSGNSGLYFAQFPKNFDKLQAVLVAKFGQNISGEATWYGVPQFYREIIFTEPELLIAPQLEENIFSESAIIIAEKQIMESEKLSDMLEKFSLQRKASVPVTRSMFLYCLEFVLAHRLAPLWNKIDKYFIQGRDFLAEENRMSAIQANFIFTDKLTLALKAQWVKLPKPKVEDFGVSSNILQRFQQSDDFSIHGYSLENNKCLALPSLKTGYITCISHQNVEGIDFKKYWKIMYGFRLPVSPERDVFYSIRFPVSDKVFSYPEYCIRHKEPQLFLRCDQRDIFRSFLEDLALRMPSVCGVPLTFTSSTLYPTASLHLASSSKQTNLSRTSVLSKAHQPFTFTKKTSKSTSQVTSSTITSSSQGKTVISSSKGPERQHEIQQCSRATIPCTLSPNVSQLKADTPLKAPKPYVPTFTKHKSIKNLPKKQTTLPEVRKELETLVPYFKRSVSAGSKSTNKLAKTGARKVGASVLTLPKQQASVASNSPHGDLQSPSVRRVVIDQGNSGVLAEQNKQGKVKSDVLAVNVRKMVAENKLSKLSVAAITKWLKSEGVKCKCKEKKQELMIKVYLHLGLKQREP